MRSNPTDSPPVLIVGAGPTGLGMACELLRLYELVRGAAHTLLLSPGTRASDEQVDRLEGIAARVSERYGALVRHHFVMREPRNRAARTAIAVDADGEVHRALGAQTDCLYLVRPASTSVSVAALPRPSRWSSTSTRSSCRLRDAGSPH